MIDDVEVIKLFIYYILLVLIYIMIGIVKKKRKKELLYELIFMVAVPFIGLFLLFISGIFLEKDKVQTDLYRDWTLKGKTVEKTDLSRDRELMSIKDVLSYSSVEEKRNMVLDLFRYDSEGYIKDLKMALNDPDTEVSHYASSALVDLLGKMSQKVSEARITYEKEKSDSNLQVYLGELDHIILSGILTASMENKYKQIFCEVLENSSSGNVVVQNKWVPSYILYSCDIGEKHRALQIAADFIENDPSEISYMTALRTTYTLKEGEAFRMYLSKLKEEEFVLNDLNYETLQFFLRGE